MSVGFALSDLFPVVVMVCVMSYICLVSHAMMSCDETVLPDDA